MKSRTNHFAMFAALSLACACASHDHQDVYLLGSANEGNIALQAERDVNLPNSKAVDATSGMRAAKAVKALNEGKTRELREASASAGGDS